jgi:hypothetical protein
MLSQEIADDRPTALEQFTVIAPALKVADLLASLKCRFGGDSP